LNDNIKSNLEINCPVDTITLSNRSIQKSETHIESINKEKVENVSKSKKLLVVEDDLITQDVLGFFLQDLFELDFASTFDEAISKVQENDYIAVLMDINLGRGKNGLHVTSEIRKMKGKEKLPIVAQTAFALRGDKEEFLEAGCDYYLSKPFTKQELRNILLEIKNK